MPTATPATPAAQAGIKDNIARTRALPVVPVSGIPPVPDGYRPADLVDKKRSLRLMPAELRAEAIAALAEIDANAANVAADLGELAPDPAQAKDLLDRVQSTESTLGALNALVQYHSEIEGIALSDAIQILEETYAEYQHRVARKPQLAVRYPSLAKFFQFRSDAIAAGIARAKAAATTEPPPAEETDDATATPVHATTTTTTTSTTNAKPVTTT